ncbi:MAG: regulatory protein RecX [Candidatus Puniceispirillaceae bacterium]
MISETELREKSRAHKRLMNKALHYLGRYQASTAQLRRILDRFAKRKIESDDPSAIQKAIEDVISLCADYGYIDDSALAASKTRASVAKGQSERQLAQKLRMMGISNDTAEDALIQRKEGWQDAELAAIIRKAAKKKLGPFSPPVEFADKQKQMAKLARAGFTLDMIQKLFAFASQEEAENALYDAENRSE